MHALAALFALLILVLVLFYQTRNHFLVHEKLYSIGFPLIALIAIWWYRTLRNIMEQPCKFSVQILYGRIFKNSLLARGFLICDNFRLQEGIPGYALALLFFPICHCSFLF